jgi:hypothetical protein
MHEDMIHVPDAFPTGIDDATPSSPAHLRKLYSPECVEGEFYEVRRYGVLRSSPLIVTTADFGVVDPHRMMRKYGPAEGFTRPLVHAWLVWVNINAIRCRKLSEKGL